MDDVEVMQAPVMPRREAAASEVFVVELAEYSGPLDLLLTLIRDEQIDIYDIPIARIAEQFLARISTLKLDEAADYLEMAARLVRIKAQMLLPRREGDDVWEGPRPDRVPSPRAGPLKLSLPELLSAVDRVLRLARRPHVHDVVPRALDVDGAIGIVRALMAIRDKAQWKDVVPKKAEPWDILSVLLALLELAKRGELRLSQPRAFAAFEIRRESAGEAA